MLANTFPAPPGVGISIMNLGPGSTLQGTLERGLYCLSCELTDDSLASCLNPLLTVYGPDGTVMFTIDRPGQYTVAQPQSPNGMIKVVGGGDAMWRRVSLNDISIGDRKFL